MPSSKSSRPISRPLRDVCPHVVALLTNTCVLDEDLEAIGFLQEPPVTSPVPPPVWGRILLNRFYRDAPQALGDRLDLRHADEILAVRGQSPAQVQARADEVLARGEGRAVPGLLWAAATDGRLEVQRIAARLGFSSTLLACREFVETPPVAPA